MILKASLPSEVVVSSSSRRLVHDGYTSCWFEYFSPYHLFRITTFHQSLLRLVAALIKLFIIRTDPVISQGQAIGYTFLAVVFWIKKLMSVIWYLMIRFFFACFVLFVLFCLFYFFYFLASFNKTWVNWNRRIYWLMVAENTYVSIKLTWLTTLVYKVSVTKRVTMVLK